MSKRPQDITITTEAGHGLNPATAGKRTPPIPELNNRVILEREFNEPAKNFFIEECKRIGFNIVDVAPELSDVPLSTRVSRSNNANADLHVSWHYNAFRGVWGTHGGIETYKGSSQASHRVSTAIQKHLIRETDGFRDRGVKDGSWLFLNRTRSPLALVECGFMDNKREAMLMLDEAHQKACAVAVAKGVCEYFGVKYVPEKTPVKPPKVEAPQPAPRPAPADPIYRVIVDGAQVGAFSHVENLTNAVEKAHKEGAKEIKLERV